MQKSRSTDGIHQQKITLDAPPDSQELIVCIGGHKIGQRVDKLEKVGVGCTQTTPIATRFQSNRTPLGCVGTGDSHHGCVASNSTATM